MQETAKAQEGEKDAIIDAMLSYLMEMTGASQEEILEMLESKASKPAPENQLSVVQLPISIFRTSRSCLESISLYLHNEKHLSFTTIARLTKRSPKTIWGAYQRAERKSEMLSLEEPDTQIRIPLGAIADRNLSTLESIVTYLRDTNKLRFSQIAKMLMRDPRTIWTTYRNATRKKMKAEKRAKR